MDVTIPCPCPPNADGTPRHASDTVSLKDRLTFREAMTITKAVALIDEDDEPSRAATILATLSEFYILIGIASWTVRGTKPIELTKSAIRQYVLERPDIAAVVSEAADELYSEAILLPLLARASNSLRPSPTNEPTSAKQAGEQQRRPRPSKRSSTSTTPTGATETTSLSLVGVSSSSQSSESAA
jgi:hypothetical protein